MPDIQTTVQFQADITDFKGAMQEANRSIKLANSQFKAASSGMDDWGNSTDGLTAKLEQLSTLQAAQKRKLDVLNAAYREAVEAQGENSAAAVELRTKINNQQAVVNKTKKEFDAYAAKLAEVESGASGAASDIKKAGDAAKKAGEDAKDGADGWTIMKDVIADFVSNAVQGAIDALANLAEETREYRRDMAQLAQNASDTGHDMGAMKDALKDVAKVTGETDAAMEGLNMLMATGMNTDNLTTAAEALAGAATRFDGLKFEGMAEGLQESLAVGEAVGPFAELIERTGGSLESFNEKMAACSTEAERQQLVMQFLNESGLQGVHEAYVRNNADLVAAEEAQFRYNDALAKVGAAIEPINTGLANIGATILEKVAPVVENIVQWVLDNGPLIEPIVTGIAVALGVLAAALAIQGLINGVSKAFSLLTKTILANPFVLFASLIAGVAAGLVHLYKTNETFRNKVNAAWASVKNGIGSAISWVGKKFDEFVGWCKALPGKISSAISGAISSVAKWGANLASKGREAAGKLVSSVVDGLASLGGKMLSIGSNIVSGLWQGISGSFTWIKNKISGWVGDVMSFIKNLFGINSPSRVMRDEVGKMLGLGMAEGIQGSRSAVQGAMRSLGESTLGSLSGGTSGAAPAAAGGKAISFTQVINSPRALTRREIYRQTHNALVYAGGAF